MRMPSVTIVSNVGRKIEHAFASHIPNNSDDLVCWYESRYCKGLFWDCRWVNFDK